MSRVQWFNGKSVPEDSPVLSTSDRGFRYGDGFFETMRVADGRLLFAERHWKRLKRTADTLGIRIPADLGLNSFIDRVINTSFVGTRLSQVGISLPYR